MRSDVSSSRREVSSVDPDRQRPERENGPSDVRLGVAIAVGASAILHVSVLGALALIDSPEPEKKKPVRVTVVDWKAKPLPVSEPMDVVLFEVAPAPTAGAAAAVVAAPEPSRSTSTSTITSTTTAGGGALAATEGGTGTESSGGYGKLSMRRPDLGTGELVGHRPRRIGDSHAGREDGTTPHRDPHGAKLSDLIQPSHDTLLLWETGECEGGPKGKASGGNQCLLAPQRPSGVNRTSD